MYGPLLREFLKAGHFQMKAVARDHLHQPRDQNQNASVTRLGWIKAKHFRIVRFFGENCFPSSECDPRSGAASAAGRTLQHSVDQVAHGVDFGELRLLYVAAEFFFEPAEQFHALHRIEAEIEFQIQRRAHRGGAASGAYRG